MHLILPTFLIIGAQKCGTTALAYSLRRHPEVFLPRAKEAHFFGTAPDETVYGTAYQKFFQGWRGQPHIGEATPNYLTLPSAPQQISKLLPYVRLIVSLRNPVDRAYSAYWHAVREGALRGSFDQVIGDPTRLALARRWSGLISDGMYYSHLMAYKRIFRPEQIYVLLHEDLIANPPRTLAALATFLGLGGPPLCTAPQQNQTSHSSLPYLLRPIALRYFPAFHKRTLIPFVPAPMRPETRTALCRFFRADNERLSECLGRDITSWTQDSSSEFLDGRTSDAISIPQP